MTERRIIKKYPNRRLYDTAVSRYITLQEIKQMVMDCVDFQVIDAKTEEELTHSTLLQIILEQEGGNSTPMFSRDVLEKFIRSYGDSMQSMMNTYLQQSLNFYSEQQNKFKQGFDALLETNPLNYFSELTNNNLRLWQSLSDGFLKKKNDAETAEKKDK